MTFRSTSLCVLAPLALLTGCATVLSGDVKMPELPQASDPWWAAAREQLEVRRTLPVFGERARNVILFIGDAMGVSTITASRIYDGQQQGAAGEENVLAFETFPHVALVKTYNSNQQVPDSAGTASAIHTGVKTRAGVLGVSSLAQRGQCADALAHRVATLGEMAEQMGLSTGIVTTATVTHATPAAVYAHSADRTWEDDRAMPAQAAAPCTDIARQLVEFSFGDGIDVALGGGRDHFTGARYGGRRRNSEDNLIQAWLARDAGRAYVTSKQELAALDTANVRQILGLFNDSYLSFERMKPEASAEPSLSEMTAAAIDMLARNPRGYYLLVEGGRIDHAHHAGVAELALAETRELARAVATALAKVDLSETLVLVTADHSSTLTIGGHPTRGNPILGLVRENDRTGAPGAEPARDDDGRTYTTLGYYNGPGAQTRNERPDITKILLSAGLEQQRALVPTLSIEPSGAVNVLATHGGEDVPLYATGPSSQRVGGVLEQHVIFHIIANAFGWPLP